MARAIILASFFTLECYAARLKNVHESDFVRGQLVPGPPSALMPRMAAAHMEPLTRTEPWRNLHGGVGRRAPSVSMQDTEYVPNLPTEAEYDQMSGAADNQLVKERKKGKKTVLMPGGVGLTSGAAVLPHPRKADRTYELFPHCGGEDAYFIDNHAGVVGVADGVGASAARGVDSGIYSRQLMQCAAEETRSDDNNNLQDDPVEILQRAYERTLVGGSSTALILAFSQEQVAGKSDRSMTEAAWKVKVANLGDSGFIQLRKGEVLFQSTPLTHNFNQPFQLSADNKFSDSPAEAQSFELEDVLEGDVFVLGTDGLWDNAFGEEVATIVRREETKALSSQSLVKNAASALTSWAADGALKKPGRATPWGMSKDILGYNFVGGKLDDITVVVVVVGSQWSTFGL